MFLLKKLLFTLTMMTLVFSTVFINLAPAKAEGVNQTSQSIDPLLLEGSTVEVEGYDIEVLEVKENYQKLRWVNTETGDVELFESITENGETFVQVTTENEEYIIQNGSENSAVIENVTTGEVEIVEEKVLSESVNPERNSRTITPSTTINLEQNPGTIAPKAIVNPGSGDYVFWKTIKSSVAIKTTVASVVAGAVMAILGWPAVITWLISSVASFISLGLPSYYFTVERYTHRTAQIIGDYITSYKNSARTQSHGSRWHAYAVK